MDSSAKDAGSPIGAEFLEFAGVTAGATEGGGGTFTNTCFRPPQAVRQARESDPKAAYQMAVLEGIRGVGLRQFIFAAGCSLPCSWPGD